MFVTAGNDNNLYHVDARVGEVVSRAEVRNVLYERLFDVSQYCNRLSIVELSAVFALKHSAWLLKVSPQLKAIVSELQRTF